MSISTMIHTARTGLLTTQTQIAVTTNNLTNAKTEGYTVKTVSTATLMAQGRGAGVTVVGIGNTINEALSAKIRKATSATAAEETKANYLQTVLTSLGTTKDGSALESSMTALMDAINTAVYDGAGADALLSTTESLETWTTTLRDSSNAVRAASNSADDAIGESIEQINDILQNLDKLNDKITLTTASGKSAADLIDTQRTLLKDLSALVDITAFSTNTGEIRVYASNGQQLLTSSAMTLEYTTGGTNTSITLNGKDITSNLKGGTLGSLISLRQETLPDIQAGLDNLATTLADTINAKASLASASPPPSTLTSANTIASAGLPGTGTITFMTVSQSGTTEGNVLTSVSVNLSTITSAADLNTALAGSNITATEDATTGHLVLSASSGGVVLSGDGTVGTKGFAHALGINTLVSGTNAADMKVLVDETTFPTALPASTTVGEKTLITGDTSGLQKIWGALDDDISFSAAGTLPAASKSAVGRIAALLDDLADRTEATQEAASLSAATRDSLATTFDNAYGVNTEEEQTKLVSLEQSYKAIAQIMTTAQDMFDSLLSMMK
ncbi:flagellar hook-associated protein FlgK [Pararhodospirillum photometricum]|uniref:Flagellar hook-associated protein 1 n=1 Tax=Pararhodospirillum photometricum DSM 122 TaxID=1150469 RepID=H6SN70_PARPM|nr:flagellar basal body rod C-terminal domain-containing protein [Pararhodospirillum photometricum]CCG06946.1 Putative uncharacterized protein [Pararhodospirillum photometricum DSM 122]